MAEERPGYDRKLALILRTAAGIFAEKGYHQASIRDISRATGVSLSGLYYYFRSKEDLLFRIQDHCFGTVLENLEALLADERDPRRRLELLVENHLAFFVNNMEEMKVLSHEAESLTGTYRARVNAKKRRYSELCSGILQEIRPAADAGELRVATYGLFGMMNWIYNWYRPGRDVPVAELAREMSQLYLSGYEAGARPPARPPAAGRTRPGTGPSIWRQ
jgi:TetR/AcrR family transcriptional regulator, cholesterol catabolism regulator